MCVVFTFHAFYLLSYKHGQECDCLRVRVKFVAAVFICFFCVDFFLQYFATLSSPPFSALPHFFSFLTPPPPCLSSLSFISRTFNQPR